MGKKLGKNEKKMTLIVPTNVVASRLPERRPTGMPHARASLIFSGHLVRNLFDIICPVSISDQTQKNPMQYG